jgi:pyridoxine 5-phosphate synthase
MMPRGPRLGLNIDHVATLRNARGGRHPDPIRAALMAQEAGVDGITAHLREDRRHILDEDLAHLLESIGIPLNLELAATPEMLSIALDARPHAVCIVPERRLERTTEGGLQVIGQTKRLAPMIAELGAAGIRVSLFIEPDPAHLDAAKEAGAPVIELHTGAYSDAAGAAKAEQLRRIVTAAAHAAEIGLECHAGHGLTFANVQPVAAISTIAELNIGHFIIGEALFTGLVPALHKMRSLMDQARAA